MRKFYRLVSENRFSGRQTRNRIVKEEIDDEKLLRNIANAFRTLITREFNGACSSDEIDFNDSFKYYNGDLPKNVYIHYIKNNFDKIIDFAKDEEIIFVFEHDIGGTIYSKTNNKYLTWLNLYRWNANPRDIYVDIEWTLDENEIKKIENEFNKDYTDIEEIELIEFIMDNKLGGKQFQLIEIK